MLHAGVPLDGFGVGTELVASKDSPTLSMVYKLVAVDGEGRVKLAPGKRTYPLAKQVWRRFDQDGRMAGDTVTAATETAEGQPLLVPVLQQGRLVSPLPALDAIRDHCLSAATPSCRAELGPTRRPNRSVLRPPRSRGYPPGPEPALNEPPKRTAIWALGPVCHPDPSPIPRA